MRQARDLITGAFVADAASMGLHWIYDQNHIQKIAPSNPEFRTPSAADYKDVPGYFAHENRVAGDQSQYGHQALVMLRSLHANDGHFNVNHYSQLFRKYFGYGGDYIGYIDHATRETLDNFIRLEDEALTRARALPFDGDESLTTALVIKALSIRSQYSAEMVTAKFEEAIRITHDNEKVVAHGFKVLAEIEAMGAEKGADDEQFPATSKLAPLIGITRAKNLADGAELIALAESAITVTHSHARALSYGGVVASMMEAAADGSDAEGIVQAALSTADAPIKEALGLALSMKDQHLNEVTQHFGLACDLRYGVPSIVHNIANASSYSEAIRNNIYAGGDTCGRSMILGALAGAVFGVDGESGIPSAWIDRLSVKQELDALLDALLS